MNHNHSSLNDNDNAVVSEHDQNYHLQQAILLNNLAASQIESANYAGAMQSCSMGMQHTRHIVAHTKTTITSHDETIKKNNASEAMQVDDDDDDDDATKNQTRTRPKTRSTATSCRRLDRYVNLHQLLMKRRQTNNNNNNDDDDAQKHNCSCYHQNTINNDPQGFVWNQGIEIPLVGGDVENNAFNTITHTELCIIIIFNMSLATHLHGVQLTEAGKKLHFSDNNKGANDANFGNVNHNKGLAIRSFCKAIKLYKSVWSLVVSDKNKETETPFQGSMFFATLILNNIAYLYHIVLQNIRNNAEMNIITTITTDASACTLQLLSLIRIIDNCRHDMTSSSMLRHQNQNDVQNNDDDIDQFLQLASCNVFPQGLNIAAAAA